MPDIIVEVEAKLEALKLRLPSLDGKANKKERTQVNKEIYNLENGEEYCAAVKAQLDGGRVAASAADDEAHKQKLVAEEAAKEAAAQAAAEKAAERAANGPAAAEDDGERHLELERKNKGDGVTKASHMDWVEMTYRGRFAPGTAHDGKDYSDQEFDSSYDSKFKKHKPLKFQLGAGKAIRGWEEALKEMTLGESVEATIGPKWAYRKGGIQDDTGVYVVPPHATLIFQMELVAIGKTKANSYPPQ